MMGPEDVLLPGRAFSFEAAVLFADMVGSTSLAEWLASQGPRGIETLDTTLNAVFGPLVETAHTFGGEVTHFVGDALVCVWEVEEDSDEARRHALLRACAAALEMRTAVARIRPLETPFGPVNPAVRIGLGHGPVKVHILGSREQRLWMISGPALRSAIQAETKALPNHVTIHPTARRRAGDAICLLYTSPSPRD